MFHPRTVVCVAALCLSTLADAAIEIRAFDEAGMPVPGAVAHVVTHTKQGPTSHGTVDLGEDAAGEFAIYQQLDPKLLDVWVAAPGFASGKREVVQDFADAKVAVTLSKGVETTFRISTASGKPLPDNARVFCYDEETVSYAWRTGGKAGFSLAIATRVAPDVFAFNVAPNCGPL